MKYEFETIETLIRSAFDEKNRSSSSFDEQFAQVRNAVAAELDRIRNSFVLTAWEIQDPVERSSFVQYHQNRLTVIIDKLFQIAEAEKGSKIGTEAFFLYDLLEQILKLIEEDLPDYFDFSSKAPDSIRSRVIQRVLEKITPSDTQAIARLCQNEIVQNLRVSNHRASYLILRYSEELAESLSELSEKGPSAEDYDSLLILMNFNATVFVSHYTGRISASLEQLESNADRMERLSLHLKQVNQARVKSVAFIPTAKPIQAQIGDWILEEINFLERKLNLITDSKVSEKEQIKRDFKLEFDMSVAQFAFFIKAFIETGVIQNKNISELIRFLAKFVKTKRSENIAYESFRMKYYNVESGTKDAVRNLLHSAIGYINSD